MKLKVALIQQECSGDRQENLALSLKCIFKAAKNGSRIVCLQELFNTTYFPYHINEKYIDWAEPIPGPTIKRIQESARDNQIIVIAPVYEAVEEGAFYNTAVVIDHEGEIMGRYRKNHIPEMPLFHEKFYFKPGNLGYPIFKTPFGNVAVCISYDYHFPECIRLLGLYGADIIFIPSAAGEISKCQWDIELRAHAIANGIHVCGINRVGTEGKTVFFGNSLVASPMGEIVAIAGNKDEILYAEIDLLQNKKMKRAWQFLRDRRPETYIDIIRLIP